MATKTRNISLPPALDEFVERKVRGGQYGNASNVIQAGLRALAREEMGASLKRFNEIMADLPAEPITPEMEQAIVRAVRKSRAEEKAGR
ncbi:MAG: type II toxin-antitoxin system ParD family antitoxin [Verrucomicrobiae bacterium]|nr:type II toxin-antitoxin system ParD family antitoxin [Verrucomicrobiae bacterium]